uniref:ATP synthase CF0 subunit II n=1 Tax=Cryptomonas sp. CCAC 1634B TaxID=2051848 RepID=A0A679C9W9_9CRYP|nr:ATP synthase CF0 subunit II [Cryptomonas sp. CCAC 1634B]
MDTTVHTSSISFLQILCAELKGGIFDINATLPLMMVQFMFLTMFLDRMFYIPVKSLLDVRDVYIRKKLSQASKSLATIDDLLRECELVLAQEKRDARASIESARKSALEVVAFEVCQANIVTQQLVLEATHDIEVQREMALHSLEMHVDDFSERIVKKLTNLASTL